MPRPIQPTSASRKTRSQDSPLPGVERTTHSPSQMSPKPSESVSVWVVFASVGQLSVVSGSPSPSSSVSVSSQIPSPSVSPVASSPVQRSLQSGTPSLSVSARSSSPGQTSRSSGIESPSVSAGISRARNSSPEVVAYATVCETACTLQTCVTEGMSETQLAPPSIVSRMNPHSPAAQPWVALARLTSLRLSPKPMFRSVQVAPPSSVE